MANTTGGITDDESESAMEQIPPAPKRVEPSLDRSVTLNFIGDWGQANFHRICSWLTQEFCDRSGPRSRVGIWNVRGGGIEALHAVHDGEAQLSIATPAQLLRGAITGQGMFTSYSPSDYGAMSHLRALAVLPQNDRMVFAIDPKFGVRTFEELRQKRPALRVATSTNDGTNFIGYVAAAFMDAHGVGEEVLRSWGGSYVTRHRPEQTLIPALDPGSGIDAVLQEAIMTPWWADLIEKRQLVPLPAESGALEVLYKELGLPANQLPRGYWPSLGSEIPALDFSDFVVLVRDDLPEDVAHLLTWCLVETREVIERQYRHLPPERSPLTYPLIPGEMAKTPLPLHPGARRYYEDAGYLQRGQ